MPARLTSLLLTVSGLALVAAGSHARAQAEAQRPVGFAAPAASAGFSPGTPSGPGARLPPSPAPQGFGAPQAKPAGGFEIAARPPAGSVATGAEIKGKPVDRADVDESALRYYASQNNKQRVDAEIKRLRTLHPNWSVPDDLYSTATQQGPDEQMLWELFQTERLEELHSVIEARKKAEPGWLPSRDLMLKLRRKETRQKVLAFWNEKQWKKLVQFARSEPMIAEVADVEVLWTLAEGFANTKQKPEALGIYKTILENTTTEPERIGTIHKAMANLPMSDVETLIATGRVGADGRNEFDVILVDITRARMSAFLHEERLTEVPPADVKAFEDYARKAEDPNQPALVAWYRYRREEFVEALEWFKYAVSRGGDAMVAHGLAHSLRELGMYRETEEVAYAWRNYLVNNRILFIDILETDLTKQIPPYIEPERLARYGRVSVEDASGEGAQALAWYAYNSCQFEVALEWFERAVAWFPKQDTLYGYALTLRRLKKMKQFVEVVNRYDGLFPKVVSILFPDEYLKPPTPCEVTSWEQANWWLQMQSQSPGQTPNGAPASPLLQVQAIVGAQKARGARPQGRVGVAEVERRGPGPYTAGFTGFVQNALHDPLGRYSWGVVASPTGIVHPQSSPVIERGPWRAPQSMTLQAQLPSKDIFPLQVTPENPLRYAAQGAPTANPIPASLLPPVNSPNYMREPYRGPFSFIARRVPGVGPMPYEKFGVPVLVNPAPGAPLTNQTAPWVQGGLTTMPGYRAIAYDDVTGSIDRRPMKTAEITLPMSFGVGLRGTIAEGLGDLPAESLLTSRPLLSLSLTQPQLMTRVAQAQSPYPGSVPSPAPIWSARGAPPSGPAGAGPSPYARPSYNFQDGGRVANRAPGAPAGAVYAPAMPQSWYAPPAPTNLTPGATWAPVTTLARPPSHEPRAPRARAVDPAPHLEADEADAPRRFAPRTRRAAPARAGATGGCGGSYQYPGVFAAMSPAQAVRIGWCLINAKRPGEAATAFDRGLAGSGETAQDAAYGKSLAMLQGNQTMAAAAAANQAPISAKRRNEIGVMVLEQRVFSSYNQGDYVGALRLLEQRHGYAPETRDLTLIRAWSLFQLGKMDAAERLFTLLDQQTSTKESRSGLAAIESRRIGRMQ